MADARETRCAPEFLPAEVAAQEARTTERRLSRATCGCVDELADYGCVSRNGCFRRAAVPESKETVRENGTDMRTVLETQRMRLREFTHDDLDHLAAMFADKAHMRFYSRPKTRDEGSTRSRLHSHRGPCPRRRPRLNRRHPTEPAPGLRRPRRRPQITLVPTGVVTERQPAGRVKPARTTWIQAS